MQSHARYRDTQTFAFGLTGKVLLLAIRQMSALTVMLCTLMRQETGARNHCMLAILLV
jgi:hypothetical protein